jgi:hypothetical protein
MVHRTATRDFHLAQLNIATLLAPLEDPRLAEFVANLDRVNELADAAPGFVWRLKGEGNDATSLRPFGDNVIVNMSVWEDADSLFDFVYRTAPTPRSWPSAGSGLPSPRARSWRCGGSLPATGRRSRRRASAWPCSRAKVPIRWPLR